MPTEAPAESEAPPLFAFAEIAWLREAAIALAQRADGDVIASRDLHDVHRLEPGFRKLAAHPRLLDQVRRAAGGPVTLRATRLSIGAGFAVPADASEAVRAVVFLDTSSASRLGEALLVAGTDSYRDARQSPGTMAFIATFAWADPRPHWIDAALRAEADDCLWQTPFLAAG